LWVSTNNSAINNIINNVTMRKDVSEGLTYLVAFRVWFVYAWYPLRAHQVMKILSEFLEGFFLLQFCLYFLSLSNNPLNIIIIIS